MALAFPLLLPLLSCINETGLAPAPAPMPAAEPVVESSQKKLDSELVWADNADSPPLWINAQQGHDFSTDMAIELLNDYQLLPPVYVGKIGVGSTPTQPDKKIDKRDLIHYGVDFADHPWMGRPSSPGTPVQNALTNAYGRAINNCAEHPDTCDRYQKAPRFQLSIDTGEQIAALGLGALIATSGFPIIGSLLGLGSEVLRLDVDVQAGYKLTNSSIGTIATDKGTPARFDKDTWGTYFDYNKPTVVPKAYFNITVTPPSSVSGPIPMNKHYAIDNMYHYSHGDISRIPTDALPANVYSSIKMYPFTKDDKEIQKSAVKSGISFVNDLVDNFGGQSIMSGADFGVERYGAILYQMARKFFPGSTQEPELANMVRAGHGQPGWSTGGVYGDSGGRFSSFAVTYPDTYLGGNPFICDGGSSLQNPCANGAATWPTFVPRTYAGPSDTWLAELRKNKPGRSLRAALVYLGWAMHFLQDTATPHHVANWTGFEHDRQDGLGNSIEEKIATNMKGVVGDQDVHTWLKAYMAKRDTNNGNVGLDDILGPQGQRKPVAEICANVGLADAGIGTGPIDWNKAGKPYFDIATDGLRKQKGIDYSSYVERQIAYMLPYLRNAVRGSMLLLLCAPPAGAAGGDASSVDSYADVVTDGPIPTGWVYDPTLGPVSNVIAGANDGDKPVNCPRSTVARGIYCKGQDCESMYLACGTASVDVIYADQKTEDLRWTAFTSEEYAAADCGDGYAIDGYKVNGDYSDNVSVHCVKVDRTKRQLPSGCRWDSYTTGYVSSATVPWSYWGEYAQSLKCQGSHCAKMSFKAFRVLCEGVPYGSHPVDEGTIGAVRTGSEFRLPYASDGTSARTCQDGIDSSRFNPNKTLARGVECTGRYCDNMVLACSESPVTITRDSSHQPFWTSYISEESPNNQADCGDGWAIDGVRASGDYSDNVSVHCVKVTPDPSPAGCRWGGPYWTGWVSDESNGMAYWGAYAQAVRCKDSFCDSMSFYAYRLICEDNDAAAVGNIPNGWMGSNQMNVDTGAAATQSKIAVVSDENGNSGQLCSQFGQGYVLRGVKCTNQHCDNILMSCGPSDLALNANDTHWTGDDAWTRGYTSEEGSYAPADCGEGYAADGIRARHSYSDDVQLHCVRIASKNTLPENCAWSPNPYWTSWVSESEPYYHYVGQWAQSVKCTGEYCGAMSFLSYYSYCTPPGTGKANPPGGTSGGGDALECASLCSQQTQDDLKMCANYLACYKANACGPTTCGGQDQVCGVNKIGGGTAPKDIADQTYACLQVTGGVTRPTGSNACLSDWEKTTCGKYCTSQTQGDLLMCQQYLDCYETNGCGPSKACALQDAVCGVNKIGGGNAGKDLADKIYQCLACP
jgi:hypothetical protein